MYNELKTNIVQIEIDNGSGFCFGVTTAIKKAEEEFAKVELKYFMYLGRNYINKKAQAGDELLCLRFSFFLSQVNYFTSQVSFVISNSWKL